jgi:DNA-3-methyladenine glycosylase I
MLDVVTGDDGVTRCEWGTSAADYIAYHDTEWGRPESDEFRLFEKLCLEGFQSGLSWLTILRRREGFRAAFFGFDYNRVAEMTERDVDRLVQDETIIRHRGKIESTINNARRTQALVAEYGTLGAYFWGYEPEVLRRPAATSPESTAMATDLKGRGFTFVGPTTLHAFLQAMGIINDHAPACFAYAEVETERNSFGRPGI